MAALKHCTPSSHKVSVASSSRRQRGLTTRSSGAPTAWHTDHQALGLRPILRLLSSVPRRWRPLSSNVRRHKNCLLSAARKTIAVQGNSAIIRAVNGTHRKTLDKILSDPVNGNIEWSRIESLLKAAGCRVVEGAGSSVTFEFSGRKMTLHRPHPGKEALRYRVLAVREFIERMGIKP